MFQKIIGVLLLFVGLMVLFISVTPGLWVWFILSRVYDSSLFVILISICLFFSGVVLIGLGYDKCEKG